MSSIHEVYEKIWNPVTKKWDNQLYSTQVIEDPDPRDAEIAALKARVTALESKVV